MATLTFARVADLSKYCLPNWSAEPTLTEFDRAHRKAPQIGSMIWDAGAGTVKVCSAISGTTATWTALASTSTTHQLVHSASTSGGAASGITSATSALLSFKVGDGTDDIYLYRHGANDCRMTTVSGSDLTVTSAGNTTINPTGGTLTLTATTITANGTLDVSGGIQAADSNKFSVHGTTGAVTCVGVDYGTGSLVGSGNVTINTDAFTVNATNKDATVGRDLTVTRNLAVTGTITGTYSISSLTASTLTFSGTVGTSGTAIVANGNVVTTGTVLNLSGDGLTTGKFISADISSVEKFSVGFDGRTTIAGTAASNALVVTAGDVVFSDASLTLTDADNAKSFYLLNATASTIGAGSWIESVVYIETTNVTTGKTMVLSNTGLTTGTALGIQVAEATITTGFYIECHDGAADDFTVGKYGATVIAGNAAGTAALTVSAGDIAISSGRLTTATTADVANTIVRNFNGAGTAATLTVQSQHASSTNDTLFVNADGTGAATAMQIDHEGTADCLTITTKAAAASAIKITMETATNGTALEVLGAANCTTPLVLVDGATADWVGASAVGMIDISAGTTTLAHAGASLIRVANTAQPANSPTTGFVLEIADTSAAAGAGTGYALHITSTNNEAAYFETGKVVVGETLTLNTGITFATANSTITKAANNTYFDGGAANDIFNFGNTTATDVVCHGTDAGKDLLWDSSLDALNINTAAAVTRSVTSGKGVLNMFNAVANPAGTLADGVTLYVTGGELNVMDANGNNTVLSPHTADGDYVIHSYAGEKGKTVVIHLEKLVNALVSKDEGLSKFVEYFDGQAPMPSQM